MKVAVIDYGMGNLHSVSKALEHAGAAVDLIQQPEQLGQYDRAVLPGVGAMGAFGGSSACGASRLDIVKGDRITPAVSAS